MPPEIGLSGAVDLGDISGVGVGGSRRPEISFSSFLKISLIFALSGKRAQISPGLVDISLEHSNGTAVCGGPPIPIKVIAYDSVTAFQALACHASVTETVTLPRESGAALSRNILK